MLSEVLHSAFSTAFSTQHSAFSTAFSIQHSALSMLLTTSQRVKAAVIGAAVTPMIGALCRTLKWQVEGAAIYDQVVRSGRQPILALWHGRILAGIYYLRNRGIIVITSRNFDG